MPKCVHIVMNHKLDTLHIDTTLKCYTYCACMKILNQQKLHYLQNTYIQTPYIIQNEVFTVVKKHLSNGQLWRKVVQLMYVVCPRLM